MSDDVHEVGKLWGTLREFRAWVEGKFREMEIILTGVNGENGLRGNIKEVKESLQEEAKRITLLEKTVESAVQEGKDLYYIERHKPGACIGKAALDEYISTKNKELSEVKRARYALYTALLVALVSAGSTIYTAQSNQDTQLRIAEIQRDIKLIELGSNRPIQ